MSSDTEERMRDLEARVSALEARASPMDAPITVRAAMGLLAPPLALAAAVGTFWLLCAWIAAGVL